MDISNRNDFLKLAGLVEGGTILGAFGLGALVGIDPGEWLRWKWDAVWIGLIGTVPLFAVYGIARGTRSVAVELMGQPLSQCTWYDLLLLALAAGIGEELLFRGVLQPWLSEISPLVGFVGANMLFGLAHMVTPVYALLAAGIGCYLSWLTYGLAEPNVLRAIITHGVYDFVAFLLIVREYRGTETTGDNLAAENDDSPMI